MSCIFNNVLDYGIVGDGATNNTKAINDMIEKIGEGTVYFPAGQYVTGTIMLKSNITLFLDAGAVILGSENKDDFGFVDETDFPGWEKRSRDALIAARNASCITITGRGTIDGRGYFWWGKDDADGRPRTVQFICCDNVLIEGIKIINSPSWTLRPLCCDNLTITGITIKNPWNSPNTDGINPESCSNVHISNCHIDVGDDCVTIKSGTQNDRFQSKKPCENITITNCTMINGHGGVVIGSEMSGGVKNVVISNCVFNGTDRGIRIKTRRQRGGCVEDVKVNNLIMNDVFCPLVLNGFYHCGTTFNDPALFTEDKLEKSDDTPVFRNICISNITAKNVTACALFIHGIPELPVEGLSIDNFTVSMTKEKNVEPQQPAMQWTLPKVVKNGVKITNARDIVFRNVSIDTDGEDLPITLTACEDIVFDGIRLGNVKPGDIVTASNCKNIVIK